MSPSQFSNYQNDGTSPLLSTGVKSATDIVDRWLLHDQPNGKRRVVIDYENCRQFQQQLQVNCSTYRRSKSESNLLMRLPKTATYRSQWVCHEKEDHVTCDEDYANCSSAASSKGTNSSSEFSSEVGCVSDRVGQDIHHHCDYDGRQRQRGHNEEILLKVVVDKHEQVSSATAGGDASEGDEVFYINPIVSFSYDLNFIPKNRLSFRIGCSKLISISLARLLSQELKKITTKNQRRRSGHCDAETLTDEELFATVDKDSGFIRFTLRKRRAAADSTEGTPVIQTTSASETDRQRETNDRKVSAGPDEARQTAPDEGTKVNSETGSVLKKTKLVLCGSENDHRTMGRVGNEQPSCPDQTSDKDAIKRSSDSTQARRASEGPIPKSRAVRQVSDAASADVEMNISQSAEQSSSSSSKESIQSVVSLQKLQADAKPIGDQPEGATDSDKRSAKARGSGEVEVVKSRTETSEGTALTTATRAPANESMVARAARELEAAMLRNQQPSCSAGKPKQPVAAARRFVVVRQQQSQSGNGEELSKNGKEVIKACNDPVQISSQVVVRGTARTTTTRPETSSDTGKPVSRPPLCWPPSGDADEAVQAKEPVDEPGAVSRLRSNRLPFQGELNEHRGAEPMGCVTNLLGTGSLSNKDGQRPKAPCGTKPLPPAKPAKLVAAAYVNLIQQQQQQR